MNYRCRVVAAIVIVLFLWGFAHFIYNRPKPHHDKPFKLSDKIKISIHYEALCPDSKFFIVHELLPLYKKISEYLVLDFIPYGNAQTFESDGIITFQCQHNEVECFANKIHACGIDQIDEPLIRLSYVACLIKDYMMDPDIIGKSCADKYSLEFNTILECAKGDKGSQLLKKYGERTSALDPPHSFIPTIELNNSRDLIPQALILKNLKNAVCSLFKVKPVGCDT